MKKLITIILALIMTLYSEISQGADELHMTAEKPPQPAITTTVEVPEENEKTAETAFEGDVTKVETNGETPKEEASVIQKYVKSLLGCDKQLISVVSSSPFLKFSFCSLGA